MKHPYRTSNAKWAIGAGVICVVAGYALGWAWTAGCDTNCGFNVGGWYFIIPGILLVVLGVVLLVLDQAEAKRARGSVQEDRITRRALGDSDERSSRRPE